MAQTNATTAEHATESAHLSRTRPVLIGTFGNETALNALLRLPTGAITRVAVGDDTPLGRITAIAPGALHLVKANRNRVLKMPAS